MNVEKYVDGEERKTLFISLLKEDIVMLKKGQQKLLELKFPESGLKMTIVIAEHSEINKSLSNSILCEECGLFPVVVKNCPECGNNLR